MTGHGWFERIFAAVCAKVGQVVNTLIPGILVALEVGRKQASEFVLIRGYTIKQLNTLIFTPIVYSAETKTD